MGKGDSFERECCRYLSLWWTNGEDDDVLWRNRVRRTSKTPNREQQMGDIISTHPVSIPLIETFNIEIKTGYSKTRSGKKIKNIPWDILDLIDSTKPKGPKVFLNFWEQTMSDSILSQRIPMLIFKRDFHVPCVSMKRKDLRMLSDFAGIKILACNRISLIHKDHIDIMRRDDFFQALIPDAVKAFHEK